MSGTPTADGRAPHLFALNASRDLGGRIARQLGIPLSEHEERPFEDGEHKARPLVDVRGNDVFVVHSLYSDPQASVNDKLCRLLFFIGALKDAAANRVTAVVPYLCYARKDRKTKSWDPVTTRYVAGLFEAVGTDCLVTLDVHNLAAFQNAYRCRTECLAARTLFADHFAPVLKDRSVTVVSPDVGGIKRAEAFRTVLSGRLNQEVGTAFMEKQRSRGVVSEDGLVGEVAGRVVILIDDLISTGTTMARAARACAAAGATTIYAAATHGLFVGDAARLLQEDHIENVVVTDTIPPFRLEVALVREKLIVLEAAPLLATALRCIHAGDTCGDLMEM